MNRSIRNALVTSLLALAPALMANPRIPVGIYAVVNVQEYVNQYEKKHPSPTAAEISGLTEFSLVNVRSGGNAS